MLTKLFLSLFGHPKQSGASRTSPPEATSDRTPSRKSDTPKANVILKAPQQPTQPRLAEHLAGIPLGQWSTEKILFHGCTDKSGHTNVLAKTLGGDFKWLSEDAVDATDYGFYQGKGGTPYLFVCKLKTEAASINASQKTLHGFTDWNAAAPWRFPVEFGPIAREALRTKGSIIFLDHRKESGKWGEVLVPDPDKNLEIIDVIALPADKDEARALVRARFTP